MILKKCDVDIKKRAGELTPEEINKIVAVVANPTQFRIPSWYLNRQRDYKDGKNLQLYAQSVDTKLRDDIERLKKIRNHRGLRHYWCVKVPAPEGVGRVRQSLALCCNEASLLKLFCK